ncbi:hypothetical protein BCP78_0144 [Bacillus phage BCP78]|uniref:Uncharacterized protein n=3 Tax=Tsarbombavirus BCP78 TaxID=1985182 RepID=J9PRZ0_9CAUD|nr:hypothetical protein BCP78_0144 [Bacillus phage BCP78]YP_009783507.1 hypothetical protein QLX27_gp134 [Bacillus phage BCU4]AEW47151.1 hypothetical protein BCP78_0144 [Bacillus phage BCP78]AEW47640.1 hypothetical protein BCU4_0134 [Bacillus phage BCU4]AQN32520.1 hypothetical protein BCP12_102 [Bacillus phage BCP12]
MRTQEEIEAKLAESKMKRDFWKKRMETASLADHRAGMFDGYEKDFQAWNERVKALEYVLGYDTII